MHQIDQVRERLSNWSQAGYQWVGDVGQWDIEIFDPGQANIPDCKRWALWVESDLQAFENSYQILKELAARNASNKIPPRILALYEPNVSSKGLLRNLAELAARYFAIELVVLAH